METREHWEVRVKHGPLSLKTALDDRQEAIDHFAAEAAGLGMGDRAVLVHVRETVEDDAGLGQQPDENALPMEPAQASGDTALIAAARKLDGEADLYAAHAERQRILATTVHGQDRKTALEQHRLLSRDAETTRESARLVRSLIGAPRQ